MPGFGKADKFGGSKLGRTRCLPHDRYMATTSLRLPISSRSSSPSSDPRDSWRLLRLLFLWKSRKASTLLRLSEQLLDHCPFFFQLVDARVDLSLGEVVEGNPLDDLDFRAIGSCRKRTHKTLLDSVHYIRIECNT